MSSLKRQRSVFEEAADAASPFGQSPFGAAPVKASPFGASPFGAAPEKAAPFGTAASPFGAAPEKASPFGTAASPFGTAASPFGTAASPFGAAPEKAAPFGTAASPFGSAAVPLNASLFRRSSSAPVSKNERRAALTKKRNIPTNYRKYRNGKYLEETPRLVLTVMAHGQQPRPGSNAVQTLDSRSEIILSTTSAGPHHIGTSFSPTNMEVEKYADGLQGVFREMTRKSMDKNILAASHTAMPGELYLNRELVAYSSRNYIVKQRKDNTYFGVFESDYDGATSTPLRECERLQNWLISLNRNFSVSDIIAGAQTVFPSRHLLIVLFSCDTKRQNGSEVNSMYKKVSHAAPNSHHGREWFLGPRVKSRKISRTYLVPGTRAMQIYKNINNTSLHIVSAEQKNGIGKERIRKSEAKRARRNSSPFLSPVGESAADDPDMGSRWKGEPVAAAAAAVAESVKPPSGGRRTRKKKRRSKTRRHYR